MSRSNISPSRAFVSGHSAEILFFTGVRYYRMDDAFDVQPQASRAIRKRRRAPERRRVAKAAP